MAIIKPKGIITFNPHANAPNFVLGTIAISLNQLKEWCEGEGKEYFYYLCDTMDKIVLFKLFASLDDSSLSLFDSFGAILFYEKKKR